MCVDATCVLVVGGTAFGAVSHRNPKREDCSSAFWANQPIPAEQHRCNTEDDTNARRPVVSRPRAHVVQNKGTNHDEREPNVEHPSGRFKASFWNTLVVHSTSDQCEHSDRMLWHALNKADWPSHIKGYCPSASQCMTRCMEFKRMRARLPFHGRTFGDVRSFARTEYSIARVGQI
jgi:hypothetical protein